jgi:hypothetical protein
MFDEIWREYYVHVKNRAGNGPRSLARVARLCARTQKIQFPPGSRRKVQGGLANQAKRNR